MKKQFFTGIIALLLCTFAKAQDWSLKLSSNVEKDGAGLGGASIILYKGSSVVTQLQSSGNGDFELNIPPNGDYILTVSYPGCNTKKFQISTMGVPPEKTKDNFKAEVKIEGVTMSKPLPGINYSLFNQPLLRLGYLANKKGFSDDPSYTSQMLASLSDIRAQEAALLARYAAALKTGDAAMNKKDCETAKSNYITAKGLLPDEAAPIEKLALAEKCLKDKLEQANKEAQEKAAAEAAAKAKAEAEKAAAEKLAQEKAAAEKAAQEKAAAEKLAKEQEAAKKAEEERLAKKKALAEKAAAEKAAQE
ncbi:MAG: hypothetical protein HY062_17600, partial [Bacteroidetes bacterium]|nr:hypothetical protein [Bacteroidota bacterium]